MFNAIAMILRKMSDYYYNCNYYSLVIVENMVIHRQIIETAKYNEGVSSH